MRHTRNPSRMENTFDELSAVVEDQVVVATIRGSSVHCATHRGGLIRRNRDVEIRMRRDTVQMSAKSAFVPKPWPLSRIARRMLTPS